MAIFAHLTDLHLRSPGILTLRTIDADRHAVRAIDAINARHSGLDAVIVSGDVADIGEGAAYARAATLLSRLCAPVVVVPGNHDHTARLQDAFSAFPGHASPPVAGKACHAHAFGGVTVVALDTSVDDIAGGAHHGALGEAQLDWLDAALRDAGPTLVAMHHPPFDVGLPMMDRIGLTDAAAFAAVLSRHDNVMRIVCGHVHRTVMGAVARVPAIAIPSVAHQVALALGGDTPDGLVMEPPAYAIHIVAAERAVSHVAYVEDFGATISLADLKQEPR